jgi:muramoyltetrapeptide carboxypeptidase
VHLPLERPRPIQRGTVGVFAPSSPFQEDRFQTGLAALRALGLEPVLDDRLFARRGYLAGDDASRVALFHDLLDDPKIEVLWAARGGYGAHRILDRIDPERIRRAKKPIVGFSDVSAIHAVASSRAGLVSFHAPVVTQLGELVSGEPAMIKRMLEGELAITHRADGPALRGGRAQGPILGGCLSVIAPMVGTDFLPILNGTILLLEDVGEFTYRIDRLLTQLLQSGVVARVAGFALGDFVGCDPRNDAEPSVLEVLEERLTTLGVPVLAGLPIGHGKRNAPVPLGATAILDADKKELIIEP